MKYMFETEGNVVFSPDNKHCFGLPVEIYRYLEKNNLLEKVTVSVSKTGTVKLNLPLFYREYIMEGTECTFDYAERTLSVTKSKKKEKLPSKTNTSNSIINKGVKKIMKKTTNFVNGDLICMVSTPKKDNEHAEKFRKFVYSAITSVMKDTVYDSKEEIKEKFEKEVLPNLDGDWKIEDTKDKSGYIVVNSYTYTNKEGEEREGKNLVFLNPVVFDEAKAGKKAKEAKTDDKKTSTKTKTSKKK